ncbi:MAG: cyclic nucleotide-binding domain-containing protein [Gammaproteobacteria bacterium]|nr:cyclic nucleotide-binding domain-containing protein [Gammaproteobacteria bacterium]
MATILKVARSEKELDDVFWLRHEVYVVEDGKFGGSPLPTQRIVDRYDALPSTTNIIAYDSNEPVGTIRITRDSEVGLPPDSIFPFLELRQIKHKEWRLETGSDSIFASAGMLAIRSNWRRRRDVLQALLKMATGVCAGWGVTHVIATSNHETTKVYEHLGFAALAEKVWVEEYTNHIVPMFTKFSDVYQWAFGQLLDSNLDTFWLDNFAQHFERMLFAPGETLFSEGDLGGEAYILDSGWVAIARKDDDGRELTLATLARGALFGELSLIDDSSRSASAVANTHVEVIRIDKKVFQKIINFDSPLVEKLFAVFADRIRRTDDLAMVMAFAPQTGRVEYALNDLLKKSLPDTKVPGAKVVRIGPKDLAKSAGVREYEVRRVLEIKKFAGNLDYGEKLIRFLVQKNKAS